MLWFLVAADTPEKHDYIGDEECDYIVDTTAEIKLSIKKRAVPWRAIFTSVPVNCLILTTLCNNFGVALFTTCLPSYMAEVLHFNIKLVFTYSPHHSHKSSVFGLEYCCK